MGGSGGQCVIAAGLWVLPYCLLGTFLGSSCVEDAKEAEFQLESLKIMSGGPRWGGLGSRTVGPVGSR